jgi:acyl carrier protein
MSTSTIANGENRVLAVIREALEINEIGTDASVDGIDGWDSVGHLILVAALEEAFDVSISFSEAVEITSFEKIMNSLRAKDAI